ncbi:MAG TPA: hypothetical protein VF075_12190 [Pyrinomonadaceae bacterium]
MILLLVVGLTAFSSAMKELNQFQQFTLDTSRLIAQVADKIAPAPAPQTIEVQQPAVKTQTCEMKQSPLSVELPWTNSAPRPSAVVPRPSQIIDVSKVERPRDSAKQSTTAAALSPAVLAKLKKIPQFELDPVAFDVNIPTDHDADAKNAFTSQFTFRARTRKQNSFRFNTRDRDMFLKMLNRSINLRIAS